MGKAKLICILVVVGIIVLMCVLFSVVMNSNARRGGSAFGMVLGGPGGEQGNNTTNVVVNPAGHEVGVDMNDGVPPMGGSSNVIGGSVTSLEQPPQGVEVGQRIVAVQPGARHSVSTQTEPQPAQIDQAVQIDANPQAEYIDPARVLPAKVLQENHMHPPHTPPRKPRPHSDPTILSEDSTPQEKECKHGKKKRKSKSCSSCHEPKPLEKDSPRKEEDCKCHVPEEEKKKKSCNYAPDGKRDRDAERENKPRKIKHNKSNVDDMLNADQPPKNSSKAPKIDGSIKPIPISSKTAPSGRTASEVNDLNTPKPSDPHAEVVDPSAVNGALSDPVK